jgi:DNA-binding SARP family transcriptional activator
MSQLNICCLGSFQAKLDDRPITSFESGKVRALLIYLVLEADEPHSRDELIGLLWPDRPESAARANLRQAVANLREAIGDRTAEPPFLIIAGDTLQFNRRSTYSLDAASFEEQLRHCARHGHRQPETCAACAGHLRTAVDLYRGEFLSRFYRSSEAFEAWTLPVRERFQRAALDALYHLAAYHERRADYPAMQRYARWQIEIDPWREEAHCQVMRALALSGQRNAALAQYEKCRRLLVDELGIEPAVRTRELAEQIKLERLGASSNVHVLPRPSTSIWWPLY